MMGNLHFKEVKLPNASGISIKPIQSLKSKVVKEVKLSNASDISFKLLQPLKSKMVKEVKLPNASGISFKPLQPYKYKEVKEVKEPNAFGITKVVNQGYMILMINYQNKERIEHICFKLHLQFFMFFVFFSREIFDDISLVFLFVVLMASILEMSKIYCIHIVFY